MGKPTICIGENKDADQLRGYREADQRLCFRYSDSTIPLLLKSEFQASSSFLCLYRPVCVGPVRKPHCWFSHEAAHLLKLFFFSNQHGSQSCTRERTPCTCQLQSLLEQCRYYLNVAQVIFSGVGEVLVVKMQIGFDIFTAIH